MTALIDCFETNITYWHVANHSRSNENRFTGSIISLMIIYQYHLLTEISIQHPKTPKQSQNNKIKSQGLYLYQCLHSAKGGKRPWGDTSNDYRNPCHDLLTFGDISNSTDANGCFSEASSGSRCDDSSNSSVRYGETLHRSMPYPCHMTYPGKMDLSSVDPFISSFRDCHQAQPPTCTYDNPCTPCDISRREEFLESLIGWSRCRACSLANNDGECNFVEGVGPYCWKDALAWEVVPCKKCCTEGNQS